jgi:alpha-ribazole phosphatase
MKDAGVTKWWWVRHAPVVDAQLKRITAQEDIAADVSDIAAFSALAARLPKGAVWLATPLRRTHQTAEALCKAGAERAPLQTEPAFIEQAFGVWTGCTWAELGERADAQAFWAAPADVRPPGEPSESFAELHARVAARIDALTQEHAGRDVVCVAHAGPIRAAVAVALGLSPAQALALDINNLSLTRLDHISGGRKSQRSGNWRVVGLNQIC